MLNEEFIHGQKWHDISDVIIDSGIDPISRNTISISRGISKIFEKSCIIFCKTDFVFQAFDLIKKSKYNHIFITNNSDYKINNSYYEKKPPNILYWFAENVDCFHGDLIPIPIGLERPLGGGISADYFTLEKNQTNIKHSLVYMNHADCNNNFLRKPITEKFKNCEWVTYERDVPFEEYLLNMSHHRFVFSPEGNGIDCHRTWEALYVGTIPIINKSIIGDFLSSNLPVMAVDDLTLITKDLLNSFYNEISGKTFNFDILTFSWWKNLILQKAGEL